MAKIRVIHKGDAKRLRYVVDFYDLKGRRCMERFKRERDARVRLGEVVSQRETGELRTRADDFRFEKLVADWRLHKWPHITRNSQLVYTRLLDSHLLPALGPRKLRTITRRDVELLQSAVAAKLATSTRATGGRVTANLAATLLRILLTYAEDHGYVPSNVARRVKALPRSAEEEQQRTDAAAFTPAEMARLWCAAEGMWRPFLMTVALTGLRKGEALGLQWGDIEWASSTLHVRRQLQHGEFAPPKSKSSRRVIALPPMLVSELRAWKMRAPKGPLELVFSNEHGGMLTPAVVDQRGLHPALRRAGLRKVTLHWLRHSYGSIMVSAGVSLKVVQTSMGHSSIKMTLDVYGHLMPGDHATAAATLSRVYDGTGKQMVSSPAGGAETRALAGLAG